tara:strand:+ start:1374 stop:1781 length:408 start_codon:yes stop_codon:yes gene_type:complete
MNEYYEQFIVLKMKKDIYQELSHQCLNLDQLETIINEHFQDYKIKMEIERKKFKEIHRPREKYECRENMCLARVWNCGLGGQCSRKGEFNGFCKYHHNPKNGLEAGGYEWWMGTVDQPRPERPIHPNGKVHIWKD